MAFNYTPHYPVLGREILQQLSCALSASNSTLIADLTFGGGGHSLALLSQHSNIFLVAVDQDPEALSNGQQILQQKNYSPQVALWAQNFSDFPQAWQEHPTHPGQYFAGIIMDLGVSSHHFDEPSRGFSFRFDAPLDMRMNPTDPQIQPASYYVNHLPEEELVQVLLNYGEERFAPQICQAIVNERQQGAISTTSQLEKIIFHCYPRALRHGNIHPATKTFQALRILVNDELNRLTRVLPQLVNLLAPHGRLAVISFHSLEDRIVKNVFKELVKIRNDVKIITKRPIVPSREELEENRRSRSAKLRILIRTSDDLRMGETDEGNR